MSVYLGLMSGTSMDGIDAALVDVTTHRLLGGITYPYDQEVQAQLANIVAQPMVKPSTLCQLNTLLGRQFAAAALRLLTTLEVAAETVVAIGSHGQTICHDAQATIPYTLQLGCPHTIVEATGITVVADFRTRDLIVGGKGAPFAPLYHHALWGNHPDLAIVNIGGIANVTLFTEKGTTLGFDIGPGNCLLDAWIHQQLGQRYDDKGAYAASGQVITPLLKALLQDNYFKLQYPKSICNSYFSLEWLRRHLHTEYAPQDVQATLLALTAHLIATAIIEHAPGVERVAICGGGCHNLALLQAIQQALPGKVVMSTQALGVDPDYLEAMMIAWLAHQNMTATQLDLHHITGAKKQAILGSRYLK
jgi:anhydro-N-acetylmuramic acid kinase